jgi:hypothetical protein
MALLLCIAGLDGGLDAIDLFVEAGGLALARAKLVEHRCGIFDDFADSPQAQGSRTETRMLLVSQRRGRFARGAVCVQRQ